MKSAVIAAGDCGARGIGAGSASAADPIVVGHLADYTGPTSDVGKPYGQGVADALTYINKNGGVNGQPLKFETVDYSYNAPRAIAHLQEVGRYRQGRRHPGLGNGRHRGAGRLRGQRQDPLLLGLVLRAPDRSDRQGRRRARSPRPTTSSTARPTPTAAAALVQWAAADAKKKGVAQAQVRPHGRQPPLPERTEGGCGEPTRRRLGFQVMPPIQYSLKPGDFKAQCLSLKDSGATLRLPGQHRRLDDLAAEVLRDGRRQHAVPRPTSGAMDENALKTAGDAADGVMFVVGGADWKSDAPA